MGEQVEDMSEFSGVTDVAFVGEVGPLFDALAKAQAEFLPIVKDSTAQVEGKDGKRGYTFDYAGLDIVLACTRPALAKHGLAIVQVFSGNGATLLTVLAHGSTRIEARCDVPNWSSIQELGSKLTYLKRYQLLGLLGVSPSDDDDGNAADQNNATIKPRDRTKPPEVKTVVKGQPGFATRQQLDTIMRLAKEAGLTTEDLRLFYQRHFDGPLPSADVMREAEAVKLAEALEELKVQK